MTAQICSRACGAALFVLLFFWGPLSHAVAFSDFDGDGRSDIFWRNGATGENYIYPMDGPAILGSEGYARSVADQNWRVVGIGNFDGAGGADLLWRNDSTGENYVYLMNGTAIAGEGHLRTVANLFWVVGGVGDFDGDGKDDILWRNLQTGENYVYLMDGLAIKPGEGFIRSVADQRWQIAGVGDFDGDLRSDILWRNVATGENYLYPMNGTAIKPSEGFLRTVANPDWQIVGIGDFDADSRADILWRNRLTGENYVYPMNGTMILGHEGYLRTVPDQQWQVAALGQYDGTGGADILWRHAASGENYLYLMNGTTIAAEGYTRTVGQTEWKPVGRTPPAEFEALPTNLDTINHVVDLTTGTHDIEVPASCSGNPTVACPGGVPSNPLPKLRLTRHEATVTPVSPTVYNFSAVATVVSLSNIPIRYNGVDCSLSVNTNAGTSPTVSISGTATFHAHLPNGPLNRVDLTAVTVSGVENADLNILGGFACDLANTAKSFFRDQLVSNIENQLTGEGLCGAPGAPLFLQCPGPALAAP
jgi:hypothetical protein